MPRKQLIWIFATITIVLAAIVLYQQRTIQSQGSSAVKSVRQQTQQQNTIDNTIITGDIMTGELMTGDITSGATITGTTTQVVITNPNDSTCVISYQALVDRVDSLSALSSGDLTTALNNMTKLWYCNGKTPEESDFLRLQSQWQLISFDPDSNLISLDNKSITPDFLTGCAGTCPGVQSISSVRSDNKYAILNVSQPRSYQNSFRLISLTNGVTMLYWSALSFVDPLASYWWSDDGYFVFIASSGRETHSYVVQPKWFPSADVIAGEVDTPIALSINGNTLTVLYDRDPSNTDLSDRYSTSYSLDILKQNTAVASGTAI